MALTITRENNPIIGDDFYLILTAKRTKKGALDLTGAKIYVTLKTALTVADVSASIQKNSATNPTYFTIVDATSGKFEVIIPGADTANLTADTDYYIDVAVITSGGAQVTVVNDVVRFDMDVTRATV